MRLDLGEVAHAHGGTAPHVSAKRLEIAQDGAEQRRLPGAVGADQRDPLSPADLRLVHVDERDAVVGIAGGDVVEAQHQLSAALRGLQVDVEIDVLLGLLQSVHPL